MNNKQIAYLTTNKLLKSNHKNKLCHSKLAGAAWEHFSLPELATRVPFSLILLRFSKSGTLLSTSMATCESFKIKNNIVNVADYLFLIRCLSWVVLRVHQVTKVLMGQKLLVCKIPKVQNQPEKLLDVSKRRDSRRIAEFERPDVATWT